MAYVIISAISKAFQAIFAYFYADKVNGVRAKFGMEPLPHDERDLIFGALAGFVPHQPKHRMVSLKTLSVKDQTPFNTCVFNSAVVQKEIDEKVILSVRSLVAAGKRLGRLNGNGYSDLRSVQQTLVDVGVAEASLLPEGTKDWISYSDPNALTGPVMANAKGHKTAKYLRVTAKSDWFKALDEGRAIHTGTTWYSRWNMKGGFKAPWVIKPKDGTNVGGHAFLCVGYDLDTGLMEFQNSYGPAWGDNGRFYCKIDDWFAMGNAGYVSVDVAEEGMAKIASSYEGKDIKADAFPTVWRVENGKKRPYRDELTYFAWGGRFQPKTWQLVSGSVVQALPEGAPMAVEDSPAWPFVKDHWELIKRLRAPDSFEAVKKLIER